MLQGQTEDDISEIRNLGIETFQTIDESQIKYMLFQTVLNYITKPSYTIEEIKKHGSDILSESTSVDSNKSFNMCFFHPYELNNSNWGDILGTEVVEKLSGIDVIETPCVSNLMKMYDFGSLIGGTLKDNSSSILPFTHYRIEVFFCKLIEHRKKTNEF